MIELKNICFSYEDKVIFDDLSLSIKDGQCLGVVGANGAGKSTLLKIMTGVLRPNSGEVIVQNVSMWKKRALRKPVVVEEHASLIGYVMQRPERQLFAETVYEDVAFGPRNLGFKDDKVDVVVKKWLDYFSILNLKDSSPFKISGGQQRMAAIAGVLAMETSNICFDEPSSSLDSDAVQKIHDLIRDLRNEGRAIVLVSHDPAEVEELCDEVFEIKGIE